MKHLTLAAMVLSMAATPSFSGGFAEPLMEPEVIAEEAAAGSGGFLIPLVLLAVIAVAISNSSGSAPAAVVTKK